MKGSAFAASWLLLLGMTALGTAEAQAACTIGGAASADSGSACTAPGNAYSRVSAASGGILTLSAPLVTSSGGDAVSRISATGGSIIFNGNVTAGTGGANTRTVLANGTGSSVLINGNLSVVRGAGSGAGVEAANNGSVRVLGDVDISSTGNNAQGVRVNSNSSVMFGGSTTIRTTGQTAYGVISYTVGSLGGAPGASLAMFNRLAIDTTGLGAHGLLAQGNLNNRIVVTGPGMQITTSGVDAYGLQATAGGKIFVSPDASAASGSADANSAVVMMQGNVTTSGTRSHGVYVLSNAGNNTAYLGTGAVVTTSGADATGVLVSNSSATGDNVVDVYGSLSGGSGTGAGLSTIAAAGRLSTVRIGSGAVVKALSGQAIIDAGGASDYLVSGSAQIIGAISLGNGSDALTFDGAALDQITLFDGGDDLSDADGWVDTLTFANLSATLDGDNVVNWEKVVLDNASLAFSNNALTTGALPGLGLFVLNGGQLTADTSFALTGNMDIAAGGQFLGSGAGANSYLFSNDVTNAGTMSTRDGTIGDIMQVGGNYLGAGGVVVLDAVYGPDGSPADILHVLGNTSGTTALNIFNVGGNGAATTADGILVVQVDGTSDAAAFTLGMPAVGGAYSYALVHNGVTDPTDGNWYLRNTGDLGPHTPVHETYPVVQLGMITLPTLEQRLGGRLSDWDGGPWMRIEGQGAHNLAGASTASAAYDSGQFLLQLGLDVATLENEDGVLTLGVNAQFGHQSANVYSPFGNGLNQTNAYGLGATATWQGHDGFYLDAQGQVAYFETDLSALGYQLVRANPGLGFAGSLEVGRSVKLDDQWTLTPQAQLTYSSVGFDPFVDYFGSQVSLSKGQSLKGRLGLSLDFLSDWQDEAGNDRALKAYGIANLTYEFLNGTTVAVSGTDLSYQPQRFAAELGLGGTYQFKDKLDVHAELTGFTTFAGSYGAKGTIGLTAKF